MYLATVISVLFFLSQLILMGIEDVGQLWRASASVGLAYGGTFGLLPVITIEWFGLKHFSQVRGEIRILILRELTDIASVSNCT